MTQGLELCDGSFAKHSRQEEMKVLMSFFSRKEIGPALGFVLDHSDRNVGDEEE